jgi:hypothetical protein
MEVHHHKCSFCLFSTFSVAKAMKSGKKWAFGRTAEMIKKHSRESAAAAP